MKCGSLILFPFKSLYFSHLRIRWLFSVCFSDLFYKTFEENCLFYIAVFLSFCCFFFFPWCSKIPSFTISFFWKTSFSCFLKVVLLETNSFISPSFEYVCSFLKNTFAGYRIWRWSFLFTLYQNLKNTPLTSGCHLLLFELVFPYVYCVISVWMLSRFFFFFSSFLKIWLWNVLMWISLCLLSFILFLESVDLYIYIYIGCVWIHIYMPDLDILNHCLF